MPFPGLSIFSRRAPRAQPVLGTEAGPGPNVVVVEDNLVLRDFITQLVERAGFSLAVGASLDDVQSLGLQNSAAFLILDLALEGSDGIEVLRYLAQVGFTGPTVLISGYDRAIVEYVHMFGRQQGLTMLPPLHKPFKAEVLKQLLAEFGQARTSPLQIDFQQVLRDKQLEVWYQPKVRLGTYKIMGVEALVRLRHPEHGLLLPGQFMEQLTHTEMAGLTAHVVRQTISDWGALARGGFVLKPSINVRARELVSPMLLQVLKASRPRDPRWSGLVMELTEPALLDQVEAAREAAVHLQLHNVQLALDDFGDVASRRVVCPELKLSEININRRFVHGCASDRNRLAICEAAVQFARNLRLRVVAEGIESAEDLHAIQALGCDLGQGNLFSAAVPMPLLLELLKHRRPLHPDMSVERAKVA